jgi:hypothetical protein
MLAAMSRRESSRLDVKLFRMFFDVFIHKKQVMDESKFQECRV